jgi:polar amino acid transport system substrate-binding protein
LFFKEIAMLKLPKFAVALTLLICGSLSFNAAADALSNIKKTNVLKVGTEAAMPPIEFVRNGQIVGLGKDVLDYIVAKNGFKLDQANLPWQGILPGLSAGRYDLVATSVTITPARAANFAFTIPISEATTFAVTSAKNDKMTSLEDLNGKVGGAQIGSGTEQALRNYDAMLKQSGKPGLKAIKLYTTFPEVYLAVANREVDFGVHNLPSLNSLMKERPGVYKLVGRVSDKSYYAWVTRPEDAALRDLVNVGIKELIQSGKMTEIHQKWFGTDADLPLEGYLPPGAK